MPVFAVGWAQRAEWGRCLKTQKSVLGFLSPGKWFLSTTLCFLSIFSVCFSSCVHLICFSFSKKCNQNFETYFAQSGKTGLFLTPSQVLTGFSCLSFFPFFEYSACIYKVCRKEGFHRTLLNTKGIVIKRSNKITSNYSGESLITNIEDPKGINF